MNAMLYSIWAAMVVILIFIESLHRYLRTRLDRIEGKLDAIAKGR
jgi:hypothetical protein